MAQGKHNYVLRQTGDAIARRLGDALIAPIVTLEPTGNVGADVRIGLAGPKISQETYLALLTDIGDNLRAMGFTTILYLGDSGGNRNGMHRAANALNEKYKGNPASFYHIPEYYDYRSVQEYIQNQLGIPEQIRLGGSNGWADGIHEEYGIDALMAPGGPRHDPFLSAGRSGPSGYQRSAARAAGNSARPRSTVPGGANTAYSGGHRQGPRQPTSRLRTAGESMTNGNWRFEI